MFFKYKYKTLIVAIILIVTSNLSGQRIKVYDDYSEFEKEILNVSDNQKKVVNFFAMYCKPCLEELPYFIESSKMIDTVDFIWVSLDFKEEALISYTEENKISDRVVWLKANKPNNWIPRVHENWDGPIPITLFIDESKKILSTEVYHSVEELNEEIIKTFKLN